MLARLQRYELGRLVSYPTRISRISSEMLVFLIIDENPSYEMTSIVISIIDCCLIMYKRILIDL